MHFTYPFYVRTRVTDKCNDGTLLLQVWILLSLLFNYAWKVFPFPIFDMKVGQACPLSSLQAPIRYKTIFMPFRNRLRFWICWFITRLNWQQNTKSLSKFIWTFYSFNLYIYDKCKYIISSRQLMTKNSMTLSCSFLLIRTLVHVHVTSR